MVSQCTLRSGIRAPTGPYSVFSLYEIDFCPENMSCRTTFVCLFMFFRLSCHIGEASCVVSIFIVVCFLGFPLGFLAPKTLIRPKWSQVVFSA